jgi:hypothetical protein
METGFGINSPESYPIGAQNTVARRVTQLIAQIQIACASFFLRSRFRTNLRLIQYISGLRQIQSTMSIVRNLLLLLQNATAFVDLVNVRVLHNSF